MKWTNFLRDTSVKIHMKRNSLNRSISMKETELITESVRQDGFTGEFYQTFKKEIILILYKLLRRMEAE